MMMRSAQFENSLKSAASRAPPDDKQTISAGSNQLLTQPPCGQDALAGNRVTAGSSGLDAQAVNRSTSITIFKLCPALPES